MYREMEMKCYREMTVMIYYREMTVMIERHLHDFQVARFKVLQVFQVLPMMPGVSPCSS